MDLSEDLSQELGRMSIGFAEYGKLRNFSSVERLLIQKWLSFVYILKLNDSKEIKQKLEELNSTARICIKERKEKMFNHSQTNLKDFEPIRWYVSKDIDLIRAEGVYYFINHRTSEASQLFFDLKKAKEAYYCGSLKWNAV